MRDFNRKLRVVLIDDNANHLRGIKELINLESSYEVVGTTTSANLGINLVKKHHPDVVLMDINMPEKDGLQAIQAINKLNLSTKIVVLSGYDDSDLIYQAMKLGAKGYVLKTMASVKLINAIEEVAMGKIYLPTVLSTRFFAVTANSFKFCCYFNNATVSRAIASSSFVGTIHTGTFESGVEIAISFPRPLSLTSSSSVIPR